MRFLVQKVILIYLAPYAKSMKEIQYYGPADVLPFARIAEFLWVYVGSALAYVVGVKFMGTVRFILFQIVNNSLRTFAWYLKEVFRLGALALITIARAFCVGHINIIIINQVFFLWEMFELKLYL